MSQTTRRPGDVDQEQVAGAPGLKKTERPHPLTPFIRGWIVFVAILFALVREVFNNIANEDLNPAQGALATLGSGVALFAGGAVLLAAAAGFVSWYFTRFVIDEEELRVESGVIFKSSKKMPFERLQSVDIVQPLAARIFGLAELRLEAGASDAAIKLRYLRRDRAARLREYLLTRAHGQQARVDDPYLPASALTDLTTADRPLVRVRPQRLVASFLLSTEFLIPATILVIILVTTAAFSVVAYALTGLIPLVIGLGSLVSRRLIAMFNFTVTESPRGLRITRGLTNLTSQSVPVSRIQGVRICQSLLWRPLGLYRVDVDIVGYGRSNSENNESSATSVLLPVADEAEVELAVGRVLPQFDLDGIELHRVPVRARWLRWYDFWTLRYGWNEDAIMTEHGWLNHIRDVVPHAKTQSVRIMQGPLQRALRLANVHIDTAKGPVNAVARHLDPQAARELALTQLDRARAARIADRMRFAPYQPDAGGGPDEAQLLAEFGTSRDRLLGGGGESEVFAIDDQRVLRIYRRPHADTDQTVGQLRALSASWDGLDIGLELPKIIDVGRRGQRFFTIDRRFSGEGFSAWLQRAETAERRAALTSFLDATERLRRLPSPEAGFARLIGLEAPKMFGSFPELVHNMLAGSVEASRAQLEHDLPQVAQVWDRLHRQLAERSVSPALVHGDVCPPNAYVSRLPDGPTVTGIGDFSPHTVNGDPVMDIAGAVIFLELEPYPDAAADSAWLGGVATERWGAEIGHWIEVYRRFYGFYFSNAYAFDPRLYAWCLQQLRPGT
jgi:putative membrane protein